MNIAICDDNPIVAKKVASLIAEYANKRGLFIKSDIFNSYDNMSSKINHYDIFILDYNMNDFNKDAENELNGMDFARNIRRHADSDRCIIFMTAYPDFVYESFQVRTHRFIVKPVKAEDLYEALDNFIVDNSVANKVVIKSGKETFILLSKDIYYVDSIKKDTFIHTKDNVIKCHKRLTEFEKQLEDVGFLRIHRSYLVNVSLIDSFTAKEALMKNGDTVYISESKYSKLCKLYCK